jgi:hypothetical protein
MTTTRRRLETATIRALAVTAGVDPRTIMRSYAGETVRGLAGRRARRALIEAGLLSPSPEDKLAEFTIGPARATP